MSGVRFEGVFGLIGGPVAWFLQSCVGYALASAPCFRDGQRLGMPLAGLQWTWAAMVAAMVTAVVISLAAVWASWCIYRRDDGLSGSDHEVIDLGAGRVRFLALWGILLGSGFAVATAVTAVAFVTLPRCAG